MTIASPKIAIRQLGSGRILVGGSVPRDDPYPVRTLLENAVERGVDLRGADLRGAELPEANLQGALLAGADLSGADLTGADLCEADLTDAVLTGVRIADADLGGVSLGDADLAEAADLGSIRDSLNEILTALPVAASERLLADLEVGRVTGWTPDLGLGGFESFAGRAWYDSPPAYWWLGAVHEDDTPQTSQLVRLTVGWVRDWLSRRAESTSS